MKLLRWEWRSGKDTVGIVLVESGDGLQRAYVGVADGMAEERDALAIAEHGARLRYHEALAFFPGLKAQEYGDTGI